VSRCEQFSQLKPDIATSIFLESRKKALNAFKKAGVISDTDDVSPVTKIEIEIDGSANVTSANEKSLTNLQ